MTWKSLNTVLLGLSSSRKVHAFDPFAACGGGDGGCLQWLCWCKGKRKIWMTWKMKHRQCCLAWVRQQEQTENQSPVAPYAVMLQCCYAAVLLCCSAVMLQCCYAAVLLCCSAVMLQCCTAFSLLRWGEMLTPFSKPWIGGVVFQNFCY